MSTITHLGLGEEHDEIARLATETARRALERDGGVHAGLEEPRTGAAPESWREVVGSGLLALGIPEGLGGSGLGLTESAIVVEQFARHLYGGALLPTAQAAAVLGGVGDGAADDVLAAIATGARAAVLTGLNGTAEGGTATLAGSSEVTTGVAEAEILVLRARVDGEPMWFVMSAEQAVARGCEVELIPGVDLRSSLGRLHVRTAVALAPLPVDDTAARLALAALAAAEASGLCARAVAQAVAHAKTREQFGRPLSAFQSVQHRLALMHVKEECARAAAWDASRAEEEEPAQQRLAAEQALLIALPAAVDTTFESVGLLGAIGFTWEHDAHLAWRRALQLLAQAGPEGARERRLGELSLSARREFRLAGPSDAPGLRAEVRAVLERVRTLASSSTTRGAWASRSGTAQQKALARERLVAPHLGEPYGRGADAHEQAVIAEEFRAAGVPVPDLVIGEWVVPTLVNCASPEQQERLIPPTLDGEILWCQLFSEPGAGSDLASLRTRAEKVDGGWRLSGQKIWNSLAHVATHGACLARTDPENPKHAGLGFFLLDMKAPGIDVRPIRQATGQAEFCEVFLDEVFVPDEDLVGVPGEGWRIATTTLASERLRMGVHLGHGNAERFVAAVHRARGPGREAALAALGRAAAREGVLGALSLRGALHPGDGAVLTSVLKYVNITAQREGSRDLVRMAGPSSAIGAVVEGPGGSDLLDHLGLPAVLFGGGTPEIQLSLIARRVLETR